MIRGKCGLHFREEHNSKLGQGCLSKKCITVLTLCSFSERLKVSMLISSLTKKEECKNCNCWRNSCYLHVVSYQFLCGAGRPWPAGCVYTDFLWERKEGRGVREGESRKTWPLPRNSSPGHLPPLGCRAYNILMQTHVYTHDQVRAHTHTHTIREYCSWNRIHLKGQLIRLKYDNFHTKILQHF